MKNGNGSLDCESERERERERERLKLLRKNLKGKTAILRRYFCSMYKDSQPSWYLVLTKTACPVTYEGATTASAIESFTIGEHTRADNGTKAK
ncbi:hypothetical protein V6N11_012061 [Hibiscus sabdariffa]